MCTQTHLPPKLSFSSDFGHFIMKMSEMKILIRVKKKDTDISAVLEDVPADFSTGDVTPKFQKENK